MSAYDFKSTLSQGVSVDIAEVARRSGVPASALRFYEEKELIQSIGRQGLRRVFDASVLERLSLIALGQSAGFSLDEIAEMFSPSGQPNINREALSDKADQLDATIKRLRALSKSLRHAAACPAPSHMECPTFQRLLKSASRASISAGLRLGAADRADAKQLSKKPGRQKAARP